MAAYSRRQLLRCLTNGCDATGFRSASLAAAATATTSAGTYSTTSSSVSSAPVAVNQPSKGAFQGGDGSVSSLFERLDSSSEYYVAYRRSMCGGGRITHKALLVDAVGTLLAPSQPMAQIYRSIGRKYGVDYSEDEILHRYRWAYGQPWGRSRLRYVDDGRPFWQFIVSCSTGCSDARYFEELYQYYTTDEAWHLCDPDAEKVFKALRKTGVKTAIVSNFDTRLRPVLHALNCYSWFDAIAVSAEVAAEKPNPTIFLKACESLGVEPENAVHVGDDRRNDIWGARDAGCDAWLWGSDVYSFKEVAQKIGVEV